MPWVYHIRVNDRYWLYRYKRTREGQLSIALDYEKAVGYLDWDKAEKICTFIFKATGMRCTALRRVASEEEMENAKRLSR